jgi:hypothetical protein
VLPETIVRTIRIYSLPCGAVMAHKKASLAR